MGTFICNKCRTCAKFPFCFVTESKDGNCGEYVKRNIYQFIEDRLSSIRQKEYIENKEDTNER